MLDHLSLFLSQCEVEAEDVHDKAQRISAGLKTLQEALQKAGQESAIDLDQLVMARRTANRKLKAAAALEDAPF